MFSISFHFYANGDRSAQFIRRVFILQLSSNTFFWIFIAVVIISLFSCLLFFLRGVGGEGGIFVFAFFIIDVRA